MFFVIVTLFLFDDHINSDDTFEFVWIQNMISEVHKYTTS